MFGVGGCISNVLGVAEVGMMVESSGSGSGTSHADSRIFEVNSIYRYGLSDSGRFQTQQSQRRLKRHRSVQAIGKAVEVTTVNSLRVKWQLRIIGGVGGYGRWFRTYAVMLH